MRTSLPIAAAFSLVALVGCASETPAVYAQAPTMDQEQTPQASRIPTPPAITPAPGQHAAPGQYTPERPPSPGGLGPGMPPT